MPPQADGKTWVLVNLDRGPDVADEECGKCWVGRPREAVRGYETRGDGVEECPFRREYGECSFSGPDRCPACLEAEAAAAALAEAAKRTVGPETLETFRVFLRRLDSRGWVDDIDVQAIITALRNEPALAADAALDPVGPAQVTDAAVKHPAPAATFSGPLYCGKMQGDVPEAQ